MTSKRELTALGAGIRLMVLNSGMAASQRDQLGHEDSLFPHQPHPRPRNRYPWDDCVGPLPGDAVRQQPWLRPGTLPDWRWP